MRAANLPYSASVVLVWLHFSDFKHYYFMLRLQFWLPNQIWNNFWEEAVAFYACVIAGTFQNFFRGHWKPICHFATSVTENFNILFSSFFLALRYLLFWNNSSGHRVPVHAPFHLPSIKRTFLPLSPPPPVSTKTVIKIKEWFKTISSKPQTFKQKFRY